MAPLAAFVTVLVISVVVVRIASSAMAMTGLSTEVARFQVRSAWTGTGFTTTESETLLAHPVRRRIVSWLMLVRGAGLIGLVSTLVLSFANARGDDSDAGLIRFIILLAILATLWFLSRTSFVDRFLERHISKALAKYTNLRHRDYASLLRLHADYEIAELNIHDTDWIANRTLEDLALAQEGLVVLGVQRKSGPYLGAPAGSVTIQPGDTITVYARDDKIKELDTRQAGPEGDDAHTQGKRVERKRREKQKSQHADES